MSKDRTIAEFGRLLLKINSLISRKSYEKAIVLYPKLLALYDKVVKSGALDKEKLKAYAAVNKIHSDLNKSKSKVRSADKKIKLPPLNAVLPILFLVACVGTLIFLEAGITGYVALSGEVIYNDSIGLTVDDDYSLNWTPSAYGNLTSVKVNGRIVGEGSAKIYLEDGDKSYLVFDSSYLDGEGNLITGLVVANETLNETVINDTLINDTFVNETEVNETLTNETPEINETVEVEDKTITIDLEYNSDTEFDADNDGVETLSGVVDFTVKESVFNWDYSSEKVCTKWNVIGSDSNLVCYGAEECCEFIELVSSSDNWNDTFFVNYGRNGAGENNVVSSQVVYVNYSLDPDDLYADIIYSSVSNLTAVFESGIMFSDICVDTCSLYGLNASEYTLAFEIDGVNITVDSISYGIEEEIENPAPVFDVIPNITIRSGNNATLDLSGYVDGELVYSANESSNISVIIDGSIALIVPDAGFVGRQSILFVANDSLLVGFSNAVWVDVVNVSFVNDTANESLRTGVVRINEPVKWNKTVMADDIKDKIKINVSKYAKNISVKKIMKTYKKYVAPDKVEVDDSGEVKVLDINLTEDASEFRVVQDISVEENITGIEIEYYTEGPASNEKGLGNGRKEVVVSSDIEYENILAYTSIIESPAGAVKLYWYADDDDYETYFGVKSKKEKEKIKKKDIETNSSVNSTNETEEERVLHKVDITNNAEFDVRLVDTDSDGLVDRVEWIVPHLSNQSYEVEISVLNVQSYPNVGDLWTVEFTTSGSANLTISAVEETSYAEMYNDVGITVDDLVINELRCGDEVLFDKEGMVSSDNVYLVREDGSMVSLNSTAGMSLRVSSLFVSDYSCNSTGSYSVTVLTPGKHKQEFVFGEFTAYAENDASAIPRTLNIQGKLTNKTGGLINTTLNFTFKIYDVGTGGSALWEENQTLNVSEGVYSALLGKTNSIDVEFDKALFLGIAVGNDSEMEPRLNLTSSPYSFRARVAENLTCTDCLNAAQIEDIYVLIGGDNMEGDLSVNDMFNVSSSSGNVNIGGNLTVNEYITDENSEAYIKIEDGDIVIYLD